MTDQTSFRDLTDPHNTWVRLQTLIVLRWVAVLGQIIAVTSAQYLFHLAIDVGLFAAVIGLSVLANVVFTFVYPQNKRLGEGEATAMLLFDTVQLAALLYLSGGLHNPFSVLIIAPVTVAATALSLRSAVIIGAVAIALATAVVTYHIPLRDAAGVIVRMPEIFVFGLWASVVITTLFLGFYAHRISREMTEMSLALLATQMALAREQKLTDLGGVVAAAAHELGTPLATITLASSELADELADNETLREDAQLIREQADRCRDILRSMGRAGKDDLHLRRAPLAAVIDEAAEPHFDRGKTIVITVGDDKHDEADQPVVLRRPEIVHGLRNLIQNAVDFARSTVWIDICWRDHDMSVRIADDGPGYAPHVIGDIGEPFVGRRSSSDSLRPNYEGMGLGLFIAKTLLERTGAELSFANATEPYTGKPHPGERSGAIVAVVWPRSGSIETSDRDEALGQNAPFAPDRFNL